MGQPVRILHILGNTQLGEPYYGSVPSYGSIRSAI